MPITHVAAVQASPIAYNLSASLAKVNELVQEASHQGARLIVFPEAFLSAYPRHLSFTIGARSPEHREWFARYVRSAVRVPCVEGQPRQALSDEFAAFTALQDIASAHKVHLSIGVIERSLVGSTLWCTNLLFDPAGVLLSKHRKLQPTAAERIVWSQGEGTNDGNDNLPVAHTALGKIGGLICWENFMPVARYLLYQKGVEIYTAPTADARPTWLPSMQHIAQEGRCFVVSANQYHTSGDFPADYPAQTPEATVWSRGGSCIVGPLGEVLAGPLWDEEGILYAELDLDLLDGARLDFDPVGHYARHDLLMGLLE